MPNVVEIIITGKNLASPVIRGATAEAGLLGGTFAKVGAVAGVALVGMGVEAGKMAVNFDAAMTRLVTQAGVAKGEMGTLKDGVLKLAGKVGADPDSLAESLFHVESNFESMGITSQQALGLVETAAKGAKVGGADLVDVTNALTAAVASNIPGAQNLDQAMGALNATVGVGDMKMQDLADAFGTGMVAVVKGYGLSLSDVGAALAVFGDNNIRGAQAGTQLRMAVQSLAVPAKGGKAALDALGLSSDTLAKDMQHGGLNEAITDLHTRLVKMNPDTKTWGDTLTQAFGKKAGTGLSILVQQFDRLQSKYPALEEGAGKFGDAWAGTEATTKQKLDQMQGAFEALMIVIGDKILPVVTAVFDYLANHTEVLKILGIVVGVFLVGAFTAWAVSVIAATWPILLIIGLIAALVVGIYELWKHWDIVWGGIKDAWFATWHFIYKIFVTDTWDPIWKFFATVFGWIRDNWPLLLAILTGPFGVAAYFIHQNWDTIAGFFGKVADGIKTAFSAVYHFLVDPIQGAYNEIVRILNAIPGFVKGIVDKATGLLGKIPGVSQVAGLFGHAAGGAIGAATGGSRGGLTQINEHGGELVSLPSGSFVYSASDSDRMMSSWGKGAASGGGGSTLVLQSDGSRLSNLLVEVLREAIRVKGGNVQKVLGQN